MKLFNSLLMATVLLCGTIYISVTACSKSKCGGTTCQNSAPCSANVCVCPTGYSGVSCEKAWSDKVLGTYSCTRSGCVPGIIDIGTWQSSVTKSGSNGGYTIEISNFDKSGSAILATVDSVGAIHITPVSSTHGISASGTYSDGKITLHYTTFSSGILSYSCDMNMTKI